jgi:alpha-galactosidase
MSPPKITLIGAGSVVFAKTLLGDILQFPELSSARICLMDIDPARLKVAEVMARKMVAKLGVTARIEATLSQRDAVKDAKYVICTIQVGGYKPGTILDFEIPKKFGLQQTIADTLGVGGVFRGLRTIPVINSIGRDMAEVGAPGCLLLNYTNPMAMNCWAFSREIGLPHVGLCHSVQGTSKQLAQYAGLTHEDITYLVAGINHMAFFLKFEYRGQDAYPQLFKLLADPGFTHDRVRFEMMRRTGYFVTESSEHQSEYVPYFIHHGKDIIKKFDIPIDEYLRRCEAIIDTWKSTEANLLGKDGDIHVGPRGHEYGSYIIHARETNSPTVIYGNVPNTGLISNLPEGCCVEVPCLVDGQGVQPTRIGALPPQLAAICQTNINVQALTVEAALTGRRDHIYHAVMLDPHASATLTLDAIWKMCDELIAAHQKVGLLGPFKPVISNTGRSFEGIGDRVILKLEAATEVPARDSNELTLRLVGENPGAKPVTVPVEIACANGGARIVGPQKLSLKLPAGQTVSRSFVLKRDPNDREDCLIDLVTPARNVLIKHLVLRARKKLDAREGHAEFRLAVAGNPAAEFMMSVGNGVMRLSGEIQDSDVKPCPGSPWSGSCLEIFFSPGDGRSSSQVFLVPMPGKRQPLLLNRNRQPLAKATARQKLGKASYQVELAIPLTSVGIPSDAKRFLFDLYVRVGAVGEAHSGGAASLGGSFASHASNRSYAEVLA